MPLFLGLTAQDLLIMFAFLVIILCILEIRKIKSSIAQEIQQQLSPELSLHMDKEKLSLYLRNEGSSFVQNIKITDSEVIIDDAGFKVSYILRFEDIDFLKSQESIILKLKVFDKKQNFLPEATEKIFVHLINPTFRIGIACSNREGRQFRFVFSKQEEKFYSERV